MVWCWSAWQDLASERPWIGGWMGALLPGDTPWRAILMWADRRGLGADEADFLVEMIRVIDAEFLAAQQRKAKAKR